MKYRKLRFFSVVCVASLIISQGAIAANSVDNGDPGSTSGYSQTDVTPISVDDLEIKVEKKEYNGNTTANATVTVKPDLLNGKNVTVKYTAAAFDNENAGENKAVTISGLHLEGEDKDGFNLSIPDEEPITVNDAVITQRVIELTPDDSQLHYTSDVYPTSGITVTYDSTRIIADDNVSGIPKKVYIVFDDNTDEKYNYSLDKNGIKTEKVLANTNYKVQIAGSKKPIVNSPESPSLLPAQFDSSENIIYDDELGYITREDVKVTLRAQPGKPDNGVFFYVTSTDNKYSAHKENDLYVSDNKITLSEEKENDKVKYVELKCSLDANTIPVENVSFTNGNITSDKLMIDKTSPTLYSSDKLTLTYNDNIQKIGVSGGFVDNGTGIKSIEYKIDKKDYQPLEISGDGIKTSPFVFKTADEDVYYIADYKDFNSDDVVKGTCQITFRVTDNVGNVFITTKNSFAKVEQGGTIAQPTISYIELRQGTETELDKFLNILSFGIYTNNELTLDIKAAADNFSESHVMNDAVTVSLVDKGEDGNSEMVYKDTPDETLEDGTLRFSLGNDDKIITKLYIKIANEYGQALILPLKEALNKQWNENTPQTDSDKWVFDKTAPTISLSLDSRTKPEDMDENDEFNPRAISKDYEQFEIVASDSSGIQSFEVYNKNDDTYNLFDNNKNEYFISDDKENKYTIIKLIENGFKISDGENEIEVSIKKETITIDNPDEPDNPDTKNSYSIVDKNEKTYFFADENTVYALEDVNDETHYVIKSDDTTTAIFVAEKHNLYEICDQNYQHVAFENENTTIRCVIYPDALSEGENTFVVCAKDNAGNTSSPIEYTIDVLKEIGNTDLKLLSPVPNTKMYTEENECWVNESSIEDNIREETIHSESEQENIEKYPLTFKFSLPTDTDLRTISSIKYYLIKDDAYNNDASYNRIQISEWNATKKNGNIEYTKNLQLPKSYFQNNTNNSIKNTTNYSQNGIIHLKCIIKRTGESTISKELIIHVDKNNPQISYFKVSRTNTSVKDMINILSFGIFYKNEIKISTEVTDAINDVGIESVRFYDLNGNEFTDVTQDDQNSNSYHITIPGDAQVYQTGIKVVATDKLGNETTEYLNKGNLVIDESNDYKDLESNLILIEEYAPVSTITMPKSTFDLDDKSWFDAADQKITLTTTDTLFGAENNSGIRNISIKVNEKSVGTAESGSYKRITSDGYVTEESNTLITNSISEKSKVVEANYTFSIYDLIEIADTTDGRYEIFVEAMDNAGNVSTESVTFYRDITSPIVTDFRFSNPSKSENEKDKTDRDEMSGVTIDQDQNIVKTDYGYYFKESFDLTVCAEDTNASSGFRSVTLTLVDYADGNAVRRDSETKDCTYDSEGKVIFPTFNIESGFKGMILAEVTDNTGNVSSERSPRAFVSDNGQPNISIKVNNEPIPSVSGANGDKLYTENVSFTVTVSDTKSGLKEIVYNGISDGTPGYNSVVKTTIDDENSKENGTDIGNGWIVESTDLNVVTSVKKTFMFGEAGDDTGILAKFTAKDNANNTNEDQTFSFTIDRVNPEINKVSLISSDGTKEVQFTNNNAFEYKYFYKTLFSVTTQASDPSPSSGLNKMDYRFVTYDANGEVTNNDTSVKDVIIVSGQTENVQIPESFTKGQIFVKAYDNTLKNISDEKGIFGVVIDNTAPVISIDKLPNTNGENNAVDDDGNVLYNDPNKVSFKVTIEDTESGIKNIHYSKSSEKTVGLAETQTSIDVSNPEYIIDSAIGDVANDSDWTIEAMDHNLVTKVSRIFTFDEDDKNIQYIFDATDQSDNTSNEETSQSFTIDTVAPSVTGISFSIKTADNISDVKPEEFIDKLEYGYYFKEQMVITASCEDSRPSSGLKMMSFRFVPYKDGEQIEQSGYAEPKKSDVNDFVVAEKIVNGKATCTVEKGFKGQIFVTAYDYAAFYYDVNTSEEITTQAFVIEDNAPEIKIAELPETSLTDDLGNKLYTKKVSFKVTITDTEAGLREVTYAHRSDNIKGNNSSEKTISQVFANTSGDYEVGYTFKDTGWVIDKMDNNLITQVSQTFVFDKDDKNVYMIFGATDRSNNKSADKNSEKFTIDTVNPTVEKFTFEPASEDNISEVTDFIEELEYGYYFKKSFNAVVTVDDKIPSSGLDKVVFHLVAYENGEIVSDQTYSVPVQSKKATYLIPEGFKGQVYAQVFDRAVNKSLEETPQAFVVDEIVPTITIEPLPDNKSKTDMDGNKLYAEAVQFRVTITDDKSGLRSVTYSKNSEKDSFNDVVTQVENITNYNVGDSIGNGWQITKMDRNLITEVSQVFSFAFDDNHIIMNYRATDRSMNTCDIEKSESFTIDTTAPVVHVSYPEPVNGRYYKGSVTFNFSITERNFDSSLMERTIKDSFRSNNDLQISYSSSSSTEHTATVTFPEGDYQFTYRGEDRGGNKAQIYYGNNTDAVSIFSDSFNVDSTVPQFTTNFKDFIVDGKDEYYFNTDKTVELAVIEHNFYAYDMGVTLQKKASGSGHTTDGDGWYDIGSYSGDWKQDASNSDRHTLSIPIKDDAIYHVIVKPTDRAGNDAATIQSSIFEIDKTAPHLASRNGDSSNTESTFLDVYDEKRKDDQAPSLRFEDSNFDRIVITATIFKTKYIGDNLVIDMEPDTIANELSKTSYEKDFNLNDYFSDDGVYIFSFVAYDKAGNSSEEVNDTYFRMIKSDILAYIDNSNSSDHTGYYSLMDENQSSISKKATDIDDLDIIVVTKVKDADSSYSIQLEDSKTQYKYSADEFVSIKDSKIGNSKTMVKKEIHLPGSYFSETFKDDSMDTRLYLYLNYNDTPCSLATIHIDNEKPSATLPDYFHSWSNVMFTDHVEVTLTNISEKLDMTKTKVYECPREGERVEIQLTDASYDESKKTLTFTLSEGVHNIDISLVDEAGNEWNVDRIRYFTVGNLWLYVGIGVVLGIGAIVITIILVRKNKKSKKNSAQTS